MPAKVTLRIDNGIGLLLIDRPGSRNALDWEAQEQFAAAVGEARRLERLKALIITGAGDKAFASGGDLKELSGHLEATSGTRLKRVMTTALNDLIELPVPVIAAANGDAIGGGCEILTACDLRVAVRQAHFRFAQVQVGLTTGWGGAARLVQQIGQSRAMELLLTGRPFDAEEALALGFIHRLAPEGSSAVDMAWRWAVDLSELPKGALAALKALVWSASESTRAEAEQFEARLFAELWMQPDHIEAMAAFVEKRRPVFGSRKRGREQD
jgi:enoyl-CoA hydratase